MFRSATMRCGLILVLSLAATFLGAPGAQAQTNSCHACGHINPPNLIICEECGSWLEDRDGEITGEATLGVAIANANHKFTVRSLFNPEANVEFDYDTTAIAAGFTHYFDGRYQHSRVPIGFVPFNDRSSKISGAFGYTLASEQLAGRGVVLKDEYKRLSGGVGFEYYGRGDYPNFIEARISYSRQTRDRTSSPDWPADTNDWLSEEGEVTLASGYQNTKIKAGMMVTGHTSGFEGGSTNEGQYWEFRPFVEYMINPRVMILTGYTSRPENDDFAGWWRVVPVGLRYINPESWFEMDQTVAYTSYDWGSQIDIALGLRRYYGDNELFVRPVWSHFDVQGRDVSGDLWRVMLGGSLYSKRQFEITPTVTFSWGEHPSYENSDLGGTRFSLAFKALM